MKRWVLPTFSMFIVDVAAAHSPGNPRVPTFRAEPSWPAIPNNWVFGEVSSIAVDSQDHVWIDAFYIVANSSWRTGTAISA